jgi:hypothetical protein
MTIKTTCICDCCDKYIDFEGIDFTITVEMFGTMHFCDNDCMRKFLEKRWADMDAEKLRLI